MGLQEKRAIEEFKTGSFGIHKGKIEGLLGFAPQWDIQWETLVSEKNVGFAKEALPNIFFIPLEKAFANISRDAIGSKALKESLKKIVICNVNGTYGDAAFHFEGGTLTFDHLPDTNIADVEARSAALQKLIESKL